MRSQVFPVPFALASPTAETGTSRPAFQALTNAAPLQASASPLQSPFLLYDSILLRTTISTSKEVPTPSQTGSRHLSYFIHILNISTNTKLIHSRLFLCFRLYLRRNKLTEECVLGKSCQISRQVNNNAIHIIGQTQGYVVD